MDDVPRSITLAVVILLLIVAGGLFSGTETAYSYCNKIRLRTLAEDGSKRAARALVVSGKFDNALITLLILINVIHVAAASMAAVLAVDLMGAVGSVVSTVVLTLTAVLFSETIATNIAKANADAWSMAAALPMRALMILLTPVELIFLGLTVLLKKFVFKGEKEPTITEDEFQAAVNDIEDDGVLEPQEGRIIRSAVEFSDKHVRDVMTPREEIVGINVKDGDEALKQTLLSHKYSRFPVYYGTIDNVIGSVRSKSLLIRLRRGLPPDLDSCLIKPLRVPPDMPLDQLFESMSRHRSHLAIVADEDGTTLGLVTMEDALEVIVGEIYDEDEKAEAQR